MVENLPEMSDSENSGGLSENEELGLDEEIAGDDNDPDWQDLSDEDEQESQEDGTADSVRGQRGRGRVCFRGRGRGRGRGRASSAAVQGSANWKTGYNHEDLFRPSVKFSPQRPPGHHLNE